MHIYNIYIYIYIYIYTYLYMYVHIFQLIYHSYFMLYSIHIRYFSKEDHIFNVVLEEMHCQLKPKKCDLCVYNPLLCFLLLALLNVTYKWYLNYNQSDIDLDYHFCAQYFYACQNILPGYLD